MIPIRAGKSYKIAWFGIPYIAQVISTTATKITFKLRRPTGKVETMTAKPGIFRTWIAAGAKVKSARRYQMNSKRGKKRAVKKRNPGISAAEKKFKDFSGKLEAKVTKRQITWPTQLILVGEATDITYRSDKQVGTLKGGIKRNYIHRFKKHGTIYTNPQGTMFVILGVKTNMKKEGIVG